MLAGILYKPTRLSFCWQTEPRLPGKSRENLELGVPHSCSQSYSQEGFKECSTIPSTTLFSAALTKSNQTPPSIYLLFPLHSHESTDTIMILPYNTPPSPVNREKRAFGLCSNFFLPEKINTSTPSTSQAAIP